MSISFELPPDVEEQLRKELSDLDQVAKEAVLVEMYRQGRLSHGKLATCLQLSRYEVDGILKKHHVTEDLMTVQEFDEQILNIRE